MRPIFTKISILLATLFIFATSVMAQQNGGNPSHDEIIQRAISENWTVTQLMAEGQALGLGMEEAYAYAEQYGVSRERLEAMAADGSLFTARVGDVIGGGRNTDPNQDAGDTRDITPGSGNSPGPGVDRQLPLPGFEADDGDETSYDRRSYPRPRRRFGNPNTGCVQCPPNQNSYPRRQYYQSERQLLRDLEATLADLEKYVDNQIETDFVDPAMAASFYATALLAHRSPAHGDSHAALVAVVEKTQAVLDAIGGGEVDRGRRTELRLSLILSKLKEAVGSFEVRR